MINILNALIPIFSLIILGYIFKKLKFPSYDFWPMADKLTYYVLMPALLVYKLTNSSLDNTYNLSFVLIALITISIVMLVLILINKILSSEASKFTSIIQGAIRFNTYVFLALAESIYGDSGLVIAVILLTFVIPFINIICISVFAIYLNKNKLTLKYLLKSIITNPLILACFFGGLINFLSFEIPLIINKFLAILSSAALPLGLLSVGFGLVLQDIHSFKCKLLFSSVAKLILTPLIMYFIAQLFSIEKEILIILLLFAVLPTAPSSFVLARQLGGDINLMSSIITIQTLISSFFIIIILKYFI